MKTDENKGSIWLNRSLLDWQHYSERNYLIVFITLLLTANHKERWWKGIRVKRGETVISLMSLSQLCGLSQQTILKILKGLVESGEIKRIRTKNFNCKTVIVNYDKYQRINYSSVPKFRTETLKEQDNYSNITTTININKEPEEILEELLKGGILLEQFCKNEGISKNQFKLLAKQVINEWKLTKRTHVDDNDTRKHLLNHVRVIIKKRNLITDDKDLRLQSIISDCKNLIQNGYPAELVRQFYLYWTQPCNDKSGRMLFESINAFDCETQFQRYFKSLNKR